MPRLSEERLVQTFAKANIDLTAIPTATSQCLNLCSLYGLDAPGLLNAWDAYQCNNPDLLQLDAHALDLLHAHLQTKADRAQFKSVPAAPAAPTFDISSIDSILPEASMDVFGAEATSVFSSPVKRKDDGGRVGRMRGRGGGDGDEVVAMDEEEIKASPSARYRERTRAGEVVEVLNPRVAPKEFGAAEGGARRVTLALEHEFHNFRYMYDKVGGKVEVLEERTRVLGDELVAAAELPDPLTLAVPRQEPFVGVGRICCDAEGKLNDKSVMLEGSSKLCSGFRVPLDLSHLPHFSLFPGQIVGVEGLNLTGAAMMAGQIYTPPRAPMATTDRDTMAIYHHYGGELEGDSGHVEEFAFMEGKAVSLFVAGGPYTTSDGLDFAPLHDLLARVVAEAPEVVILLGPFLPESHAALNDPALPHTYEDVFEAKIAGAINDALDGLATRVVMVPSLRDIHHDHVFPQPPFPADLGLAPTVSRLSNPCVFSVNEMVVAVSTNDILKALAADETFRVPAGQPTDRMGRLVEHMLTQRSFYPMFPPPAESQLDFSQADLLALGITPDILILASDLRYFAKDVGGVVAINPGRLTVGSAGGTFARMTVHPMPERVIGEGEGEIAHAVADRARVEIIRI